MDRRKNRPFDRPRSVSKTFSIPEDLLDEVLAEAKKVGHNNGSRVVVAALREYFNRRYDIRVA